MPPPLSTDDLIYDWNVQGSPLRPVGRVMLDDETLRDGMQSPSVKQPPIEVKKELLHLMDALGLDTADIGLPGAGPHVAAHVEALAREIVDQHLKIRPNCAGRTVEVDIKPMADISQKVGIPIEACLFIGSSPIRQFAEDWTLDAMLRHTETSVAYAVKLGLPVMYVTEDTTRAQPETLRRLYTTAIEAGAKRICVCDTVGHSTPHGVRELITFVRGIVDATGEKVGIDWHGHRDRGLDVANSLAALEAGAGRVHGAGIGIGERAGNTPMDTLLVNLKLLGWIDNNLSRLAEYAHAVSRASGVPIPSNYPVVGSDAFETGTGVHAAAVIKAYRKGDAWLADRVYSGVPAGEFGLSQNIRVGPMSGKSNVLWWLEQHKVAASEPLVDRIFAAAKQSNHLLSDDDIWTIVRSTPGAPAKEMAAEGGDPKGLPFDSPRRTNGGARSGRTGLTGRASQNQRSGQAEEKPARAERGRARRARPSRSARGGRGKGR